MTETRERLSAEERLDRQRRLRAIGELAFGQSWQMAMLEALHEVTERKVPLSNIAAWTSGAKPVPAWAAEGLREVAARAAGGLRSRAQSLDGFAMEQTPEQRAAVDAVIHDLMGDRTMDDVVQEAIEDAGRSL